MKYKKIPFTVSEHIELLKSRKLTIPKEERAAKYLSNVGYFRLSGYMYHLQKNDGSHQFNDNTQFNDIIIHYNFDKKLRALVLEYLERIEVALRAKLTDIYSNNYGFYWYIDINLYEDKSVFHLINKEISDNFVEPQERFLKSFKNKYTSEILPPSNMAVEILSLGKLARLYKGLKNNQEKMSIANDFGLPSTVLSSWFIYLNNVRNVCAHHSRLWNRRITANRPTIPSRKKYKFYGDIPSDFNITLYGTVSMIDRLLKNINSSNTFIEKIITLIDENPSVNYRLMGFPDNFKENPAWK